MQPGCSAAALLVPAGLQCKAAPSRHTARCPVNAAVCKLSSEKSLKRSGEGVAPLLGLFVPVTYLRGMGRLKLPLTAHYMRRCWWESRALRCLHLRRFICTWHRLKLWNGPGGGGGSGGDRWTLRGENRLLSAPSLTNVRIGSSTSERRGRRLPFNYENLY